MLQCGTSKPIIQIKIHLKIAANYHALQFNGYCGSIYKKNVIYLGKRMQLKRFVLLVFAFA